MPTPVSASPSGITFQAELARSSDRVNADKGSTSSEAKAYSGTSAASRTASKPEKAQSLSSDSASATVPVPAIEQKAAPAEDSSGRQESDSRLGDASSGKTAEAPDLQVAGASPDPSQQLPVPQSGENAPGRPETAQQQLGAATPLDKVAGVEVKADAATVPVALSADATSSAGVQDGVGIAAKPVGETFKLQLAQSTAPALSTKGDSVQGAAKAAQKNAANGGNSKSSDPASMTDAAKAKAENAGSTTGDGSSHGAQSNGQSAQHSQADSSQPVVAMAKVMDSGATQAQAVPMQAVPHEAAAAPGAASGLQDGPHQGLDRSGTGSSPLDGDEVTATTGINAAKLVQTMGETEMRVGLNSTEFGAISIRTSVSQQQMLAQISLDHTALSQAISSHIASMQTKLGNDYGLDTLIQVNHQGASMAGEQGGSQAREQRASSPSFPAAGVALAAEPDVGISPAALAGASNGYRLDIRA